MLLALIVTAEADVPTQEIPVEPTSAVSDVADSSAATAEATETIDELRAEVSQLQEKVAMAEARADRAEAADEDSAAEVSTYTTQIQSQRRRIATLQDQKGVLRRRLENSKAKVRTARQNADDLRAELASVSASASAPVPAADVAVEEPADSGCHPSYTGCVPIASDVDCAGGSGNGPEYTDYVEVIGPDEYGLDSDGDGQACES